MAFQLLNKLDKIIRFSTLITKEYVTEYETVILDKILSFLLLLSSVKCSCD